MSSVRPALSNRILMRLSDQDFALLAPCLEPVACVLATVLVDQDDAIEHTYFLESGIASLVPISPEGQSAEGGIIGREGYITPATVLGSKTIPYKIEIQMAGRGHRIACGALLTAAEASATLRDVLLRFAQVLMVQMTFSVLANAVHQVEERLARWLLMCHDRVDGDDLPLKHAFLSMMLGVQRSGVTLALQNLEASGGIRGRRGRVQVLDRAQLRRVAEASYGAPEAEYARLIADA